MKYKRRGKIEFKKPSKAELCANKDGTVLLNHLTYFGIFEKFHVMADRLVLHVSSN